MSYLTLQTVDDNFAFVIFASVTFAVVTASSANSAVTTPPSLIVTAPEETAKLSLENDAIPLLDVLASSPAILNKLPLCNSCIDTLSTDYTEFIT